VKVFRENVSVRAKVFTIGGFSAHADQSDLLEWVGHFESRPRVFLVHGEPAACQALGDKIKEIYHLDTHAPLWKERLILKPKEVSSEVPEIQKQAPDMETLILNGVIDLEKQLKALKKRIKTAAAQNKLSGDEIDQLKYLQEELQSVLD
jgi:metallo-beta-lactamase family protein